MLRVACSSLPKSIAQIPNLRSGNPVSLPRFLIQSAPLADIPPSVSHSNVTHSLPPSLKPYPLPLQPCRVPTPSRHPDFRFAPHRCCSGGPLDYTKEVDEINLKFAEAREDIEAALESKETVYFDEEAACARDSVKAALGMFEDLLARLSEKERGALQRSMGLKMEQLKAELQQLED